MLVYYSQNIQKTVKIHLIGYALALSTIEENSKQMTKNTQNLIKS